MCAALSRDGRTVISGSADMTGLVWRLSSTDSAPRQPNLLWEALAGDDTASAYQAIITMRDDGPRSVEILRGRLRPAAAVPADRLARLVAGLDAETFTARQQAKAELAAFGELAAPALRQALSGNPSPELRQRAEKLLADSDGSLPAARRREVRAVEVLEGIGSPAARELLADLAQGNPAARLTREAKASLDRMR